MHRWNDALLPLVNRTAARTLWGRSPDRPGSERPASPVVGNWHPGVSEAGAGASQRAAPAGAAACSSPETGPRSSHLKSHGEGIGAGRCFRIWYSQVAS